MIPEPFELKGKNADGKTTSQTIAQTGRKSFYLESSGITHPPDE